MRPQKKQIRRYLLLALLAAVTVSISIFLMQSGSGPRERTIEVHAKKFAYTPNIITVNRGDKVAIRLISEDVHHGLFIDGYNLSTAAYPGSDGSIVLRADKTGSYTFRCSVTCGEFHPYMVGRLRVLPNTRFFVFLWTGLGVIAFAVRKLVI